MGETIGKILFSEEQLRNRAKELGKQITEDYAGQELVVVGTLKGSCIWMADLLKEIEMPVTIDFIQASSYGAGTVSSGLVSFKKDIEANIYNKHVLIVEDIVDTGNTLSAIYENLKDRNAASVEICSMLDKPSRRVADVQAKYIGFEIDNLFVIGYGLDYNQKYRNLPYISYIENVEEIQD
ncbi:MAG: hypoxanthine phosphoribosyltransferase [Clostridia bacterium]|nr:hypoxanthine phosphoribosyltransferase [Clostridia bacterium]